MRRQLLLILIIYLLCGLSVKANTFSVDTLFASSNLQRAEKFYKIPIYDSVIHYARLASIAFEKDRIVNRYVYSLSLVGDGFNNKGRSDSALVVYNKVLTVSTSAFGGNSSQVANAYLGLGTSYEGMGDYRQAIENYEKALVLFQKLYSNLNLSIALCNHNIGKIYFFNQDFDTALKYFQKALETRISLIKGKSADIATSYNYIGLVYQNKREYDKSLEYFDLALKLRIEVLGENHPRVAAVYNNIGLVYQGKGDNDKALEYHFKALNIRLNVFGEVHPDVASSYNNIGIVYFNKESYDKSIEYFEKALEIRIHSLGEIHPEVALYYNNLGFVCTTKGDYDRALIYQQKVLEINSKLYGDQNPKLAESYNSIGNSYFYKGEFKKALEYYNIATNYRKILYGEKHLDVAVSYINIGNTYGDMGEYDKAIEYYSKALSMRMELIGNHTLEIAQTYNNMGTVYFDKGDYSKAFNYHDIALTLRLELLGEKSYLVARSYINISSTCIALGEYDKALNYIQKALSIYHELFGEEHPDVAAIYSNLGALFHLQKDELKAIEYFNKSLQIRNKLLPLKHPLKADVNNSLAELYFSYRLYSKALNYYQSAANCVCVNDISLTNLIECPIINEYYDWRQLLRSINGKATAIAKLDNYQGLTKEQLLVSSLNHFLQADTLIKRVRTVVSKTNDQLALGQIAVRLYSGAISVCNQLFLIDNDLNYKELAFYFSEQSKSQLLLQAMAGVDAQTLSGIPDSLKEKEYELKVNIAFDEKQLAQESDSLKQLKIRNDLFYLNRQHELIIKKFEREYPDYYRLKYSTKNVGLEEIQKKLDKKTALRSYFLGDSVLYIFNITSKVADIYEINNIKGLEDSIHFYRSSISGDAKYVQHYFSCGTYLLKKLFPDYVKLSNRVSNIIVIPDGGLSFIPFESLPVQFKLTNKNFKEERIDTIRGFKLTKQLVIWDQKDYSFLINKFNISYAYSATLFYQNSIEGSKEQPINTSWLAIAPVFEDESKVKATTETKDLQRKMKFFSHDTLSTRGTLLNGEFVNPLPGTEKEVNSIQKEFKDNGYAADVLLKNNANEIKIKSGILENYSILHFATHGFVNSEKPELSGLLLAQDSIGGQDGILYSSELYNLKLNADLTVLSACETGLGKVKKGEGIIGLTRALIYAGAKNIIVSLWSVSDQSTSTLMIDFYKNLLNETKKHSYSQWLRNAKMKMIKEGKYSNPYYWSPFILVGK